MLAIVEILIDKLSTSNPMHILKIIKLPITRIVDFFPKILIIVMIEVVFVAGPTIRKTKAAPRVAPFEINTTASGIDAVAHI